MIKNILIISSNHTGNGHKSITEALQEKFQMRENINVHVVDGFALGGKPLMTIGKSYGIITRKAEGLWELIWDISSVKPQIVNENVTNLKEDKDDKKLNCLIMSGGEGVGNMRKIADILLKNFDCNVNIVAGRNKQLKNKLEQSLLNNFGDRVKVYGFVDNIQELMLTSDIVFTRASPNVMMEAVACNVPIVMTGELPGQEQGNSHFAEKYNLGIYCHSTKNIYNIVYELLKDNNKKLEEIKRDQRKYVNFNSDEEIVDFIDSIDIENSKMPSLKLVGNLI